MRPTSFFHLFLVLVCYCTADIYGQTTDSAQSPNTNTKNTLSQSAGWGIAASIIGDASQYQNSLSLSTFYAIRPIRELELSATLSFSQFSLVGGQRFYNLNISSTIPTITEYSSLTSTLVGDISCTVAPFTESGWQNLRFQGGVSIRRAGRISSYSGISLDTTRLFSREVYTKQLAFGGNAAIEYLVPIGSILDMAVRIQGHIYAAPFWVEGENVLLEYVTVPDKNFRYGLFPFGGAISVGAVLRFNF